MWFAMTFGMLSAGGTSRAPASPLLCGTDGSAKRRPTVGAILSSKMTRAGLVSLLLIISLFAFTRRFDDLRKATFQWREGDPVPDHGVDWSVADSEENVDWSRYAYVQYVTTEHYLCNSVMLFERLHRLGSRADRVMLYPDHMLDSRNPLSKTHNTQLLSKARDEYKVKLVPIQVQFRESSDDTWAESFTKLLVFNQTQYSRVIHLDSDSTLLLHMDELFFSPPAPVAMPNAHWLYPKNPMLSSQLMLIQPSETEFARVMDAFRNAGPDDYDMDILDHLYRDSALVLPHRPYDLLTSEFRRAPDMHTKYLGNEDEVWDAVAILNEAKFLHFSDWPIPKPWLPESAGKRAQMQPKCYEVDGVENCVDRELWNAIYDDFDLRRARICHGR
ncbi:nucleotide-diphospho-sugar transferase [Podospora aff. communis PSN243]|uniref:Nucleotide-diphospho-sugar transferase n=1 Tax=Podospora aff. communis PSN243 TaxID=3040156 RepID=A0AAV9GJN5_9PEZI|nr:nucleotide-diphospho-sugar transferase [Podospora aff. communis PSN243]